MAAKTTASDDAFSLYVRQFEESQQASDAGRKEAEKARDYFDGKQFTADEIAELRKRKQPITPENLVKPKVQSLCGLERQGRTDPKAYPRTQADDQDAQIATDALRYVAEDQDIDIKKSRVFENMLVEGLGAVEVTVRKVRGNIDPNVIQISHDRLYRDPHSCEADASDAQFTGYITWMDADKAKKRWADKAAVIDATMSRSTSPTTDTYDDRPAWGVWSDSKRNRIRVNTHYHLMDGVWHRCVFTLAGELEPSAPSAFIDEDGNPENPLLMQAAYIDRDNDPYGIVRDMIPLQDEVNKRRSKFLNLATNAKLRVSPNIGKSADAVRKEYARADAVIVADVGDVEELGNLARDNGQFQLFMESRATLKGDIGPNASMQGKAPGSQSGRALLAQQQAGMTEMTPLLDNLRHFTLRLYRQIWNRIRQYWTAERWVRVTDDENSVKFIGVNVTKGQLASQKLREAEANGQIDEQTANQYHQQIQFDPSMQQPANVIAELDVDIIVDEVNETPTLQAEQFETLAQLAQSGMLGNPVPPEIKKAIIMASNLRDKQKIIEILDEAEKQAAQQPNPLAQLQLADGQAKVENTQADTMLKVAKARTESVKPIIEGLKAGQSAPPLAA